MYTHKIGVTLSQAERSCGNNGPNLKTLLKLARCVKTRTPRCLKLKYKKISIWMQDIEWQNPPLAPPQNNRKINYVST